MRDDSFMKNIFDKKAFVLDRLYLVLPVLLIEETSSTLFLDNFYYLQNDGYHYILNNWKYIIQSLSLICASVICYNFVESKRCFNNKMLFIISLAVPIIILIFQLTLLSTLVPLIFISKIFIILYCLALIILLFACYKK